MLQAASAAVCTSGPAGAKWAAAGFCFISTPAQVTHCYALCLQPLLSPVSMLPSGQLIDQGNDGQPGMLDALG
jgi:hypothetical protein